jgi:hypothetical protein
MYDRVQFWQEINTNTSPMNMQFWVNTGTRFALFDTIWIAMF